MIEGEPDTAINFSFTKTNPNRLAKGYPWKLNITVPSGGMIEQTNADTFQAPTKEYQPEYAIDMTDDRDLEVRWQKNIDLNFFLKLTSGNYARITGRFYVGGGIADIKTFYNPSGSPNLEYDPTNVIANQ